MSGMGGPPGQMPPQGGQMPLGMGRGYGPGGPSNEPWNAYGVQQPPPQGQQQLHQQPHQQPHSQQQQQQFYSQMPQQQLPPPQQQQPPPMGMYQGQGMPQQQATLPQQPQYPLGMGQPLPSHPQQPLQNPQQQQLMSGQAKAPPQGYNSPAPMGSVGSTAPASQQQQPQLPQQPMQQQEIKFRNELPMYPEQILNNLATYNVAQLCTIGKEIVNELNTKMLLFCKLMKEISEKRPSNQQHAQINYFMEYCELLLKKLYEIRLRIEKAAPGIKMDPDEFIRRMSESEMPKVPEKLEHEIAEFERKRKQLVAISAEIKLFDWTAALTDPATLKSRERGERN